jgi:alpha-tubulin suppressor-like RCC1 family protein
VRRFLIAAIIVLSSVFLTAASAAAEGVRAVAHPARTQAPVAGVLEAWGDDHNGQLGNGTLGMAKVPVAVQLPAGVTITAVAAGGKHTLAVTATGQVLAWGSNSNGQLGDDSNTDSDTPVPVQFPAGTVVTQVAAGRINSIALTSTGLVYAWGDNQYGQLGNGSNISSSVPVKVHLPRGAKAISVGMSYNYAVALTTAGTVLTWGYNGSGQLGNGYETASELPVAVKLPKGTAVRAIANGGFDGLALTASGRLWAWGDNKYGQLGIGSFKTSLAPRPVRVPAGDKIVAIGAGSLHSIALTSTGKVLTWGWNRYGQLGNGSMKNSDVPVVAKVPAKYKISAVSAGGGFSMALTAHGMVLAWGNNSFDQLANGTANHDVPVPVQLPAGVRALRLAAGPTTRDGVAIVAGG